MVSKNAIRRAFSNPLFTVRCVIFYIRFHSDIHYLRTQLVQKYDKDAIKDFAIGASVGLKEIALYLLIRRFKPRQMVETGVANGISTYFILKAMRDNGFGKLTSIDYPNYNEKGYITSEGKRDRVYIPRRSEPGWLIPKELKSRWRLIIGKSSDVLPKLKIDADAFFHDSEHSYSNMIFEYGWALSHLNEGGILLSDDTDQNSAYSDFCHKNKKSLIVLRYPISCAIKK